MPNTHFLEYYLTTGFEMPRPKHDAAIHTCIHVCQAELLVDKHIFTVDRIAEMIGGLSCDLDTLRYLCTNGLSLESAKSIVRRSIGYPCLKVLIEHGFIQRIKDESKEQSLDYTLLFRIRTIMRDKAFEFRISPSSLVDFYDLLVTFYENWCLQDEALIIDKFFGHVKIIESSTYYEIVSEPRISDWLERHEKPRRMITGICVYIEFCRFPRVYT